MEIGATMAVVFGAMWIAMRVRIHGKKLQERKWLRQRISLALIAVGVLVTLALILDAINGETTLGAIIVGTWFGLVIYTTRPSW